MPKIILVVHNVRSCHNVGSLLRTADGLGIRKVYLCGYTPYPELDNDTRAPHVRRRISRQIEKTALGADASVEWAHRPRTTDLLAELRRQSYELIGLEQTDDAIALADYKPTDKVALIVGSEVSGIDRAVLDVTDKRVEIPMRGKKESFNVAVAAAIALYHLSLSS